MNHLELIDLTLAYGKGASAVERLSLTVARGELLSVLGPSGCGKTTTMRAVAGLLTPLAGRIVLAGQDITRVPANRRDIGLVFQSYALFPHLSAFENVAFGLRLRKVPAPELRERVSEALRSVGLEVLKGMWDTMTAGIDVPVALHLDHCPDREVISACLAAGWSSVLFDAHELSVEENERQCIEVVAQLLGEHREHGVG